jgi:hypothetical protein
MLQWNIVVQASKPAIAVQQSWKPAPQWANAIALARDMRWLAAVVETTRGLIDWKNDK